MANNTSQPIKHFSKSLRILPVRNHFLAISNLTETLFIDELTSIVDVLLTLSCLFSLTSTRTKNQTKEKRLEKLVDYFFMIFLVGILIIILRITFNFIK